MLLLALAAAHGHLSLLVLNGGVVTGRVQAQLDLHLADLVDGELGQGVGNLEGPLLLDVGLGEDDIDLLQVTTGGLGVEEPGHGHTDEVDQGEEEVDTPGTGGGEDGGEHDDGEVGDPVGASRGRGGHGTGAQGVDLGRVDPGQGQRREGEEADEEEDTDDGTLGGLGAALDQTAHGDDERGTLAEETDEEQLATTDLLNHEERGDGGQHVDGREDTSQNQREALLHVQVGLEQQGGVVDGGVATGELLEELTRATDHHTLEFLGLAKGEEGSPAGLLALGSLEIGLHQVEGDEDVLRIGRAAVQAGQHLAGLLVVTSHDEPAWRLGQHQSTDRDQHGEEDLQSNGETPLHGAVDVRETEIDPVGDEGTDGDNGTLEADEETTVVGARTLRLPDGNRGRVHTVTQTGDDTTDDELAQTPLVTERSRRDNGTDNHEKTTSDQERRASNALTKHEGEDGTEETTQFVTRRDGTTEDRDMRLLGGVVDGQRGELLGEFGTGDDTGHQTLIITEEGETHDGGEGDGQMELLARQAGGGRPHGD